jgi:surface protein
MLKIWGIYFIIVKDFDLSNFNTKKFKNMAHMFDSCHSLTSLNISNFDTSSVTDFSFMFNFRVLSHLKNKVNW